MFVHGEDKPRIDPKDTLLPENITLLDDVTIRHKHAAIIAWLGYRQCQKAKVVVEYIFLKDRLKRAQALLESNSKGIEKWRFQNLCDRDQECLEIEARMVPTEATQKALEIEIDKLERRSQAVSREMTYRMSELKFLGGGAP